MNQNVGIFAPFRTDYAPGDAVPVAEFNRMAAVVNAFIRMRGEGGVQVFASDSNVVIDGTRVPGIAPDPSSPSTE